MHFGMTGLSCQNPSEAGKLTKPEREIEVATPLVTDPSRAYSPQAKSIHDMYQTLGKG